MSERRKELLSAIGFFAVAVVLGSYAIFGKTGFGAMSPAELKWDCGFWSIGLAMCGLISLIGNRRLSDWIGPRVEARSRRRQEAKERRRTLRAELDLKDPSRVERREKRKDHLYCVIGWGLLSSPLVAIVISIALVVHLQSETHWMYLLISMLYAVQLWGLMLKEYLEQKAETEN